MSFLRKGIVLAGLVCLLIIGCKSSEQTEAEKKAAKADLDKMQGKWKVASREGAAVDPDDVDDDSKPKEDKGQVMVVDNDILQSTYDGEVYRRQKMTLMAHKEPKQVDLVDVDENGKELERKITKRKKGKTRTTTKKIKQVGIYEITGDTFKLAVSWTDKSRPKDFSAGSNKYIMTLKKTDKAKDDKTEAKTDKKKEKEKEE
jgi:uncharacterized protein (TIGR03067 family)